MLLDLKNVKSTMNSQISSVYNCLQDLLIGVWRCEPPSILQTNSILYLAARARTAPPPAVPRRAAHHAPTPSRGSRVDLWLLDSREI